MLEQESLWIRKVLEEKINLDYVSAVLNVGSGSKYFREVEQPFIEKNVFQTIKRKTHGILHLGIGDEEGIDIVCGVEDYLLRRRFSLVLCTNLLEHIDQPQFQIQRLWEMTQRYLIITVPYRYPFHPDPIDVMYRPSNKELEDLLPVEAKILDSRILIIKKLYIRDRLYGLRRVVKGTVFPGELSVLLKWFKVSCLAVERRRE